MKFIIVDDYLFFREVLLGVLILLFEGLEVFEVELMDVLIEFLVCSKDVDFLLLDLFMLGVNWFEIFIIVKECYLVLFIVMVLVNDDIDVILQVIILGVKGYIIKVILIKIIVEVIDIVLGGEQWLFVDIVEKMMFNSGNMNDMLECFKEFIFKQVLVLKYVWVGMMNK